MKRVRAGIIGLGRSGYDIHFKALARLVPELFEIAGVADPLEDRRREAASQSGCPACADYRELLGRRDIDLIVNATPSHLHVPITLEALDAGFNVLCEKPAARTASEVDAMAARAKKNGKLLAFFQQSRFSPSFQRIRSLMDSGDLGRIVMVKIAYNGFGRRWDWQTLREYNGGNLLNTGPHPLDQALQFFGGDGMPSVLCLMDRALTLGDAEDHVKLILSGKGRPTIDLEISSCCAFPLYSYQVYGTLGGLTGTLNRLEWKSFRLEDAPAQNLTTEPLPGRAYCKEDLPWRTGQWGYPAGGAGLFDAMSIAFYRNLHGALAEGRELEVTTDQVRRQIAVIEECHRQNPFDDAAARKGG